MTPEEFFKKMRQLYNEKMIDPEMRHILADKLMADCLRSLGYELGVEVFEAMTRWYS